jgi:hypothetical protein
MEKWEAAPSKRRIPPEEAIVAKKKEAPPPIEKWEVAPGKRRTPPEKAAVRPPDIVQIIDGSFRKIRKVPPGFEPGSQDSES